MPKAGRSGGGGGGGGAGGVFAGTGVFANASDARLQQANRTNAGGLAMNTNEVEQRTQQIYVIEAQIAAVERDIVNLRGRTFEEGPLTRRRSREDMEGNLERLQEGLEFRTFQLGVAQRQLQEGLQRQLELDAEMRRRGL